MADHKQYIGDLIGGSLMIRESQLIAELLLKQPSGEQWHEAIIEQNILQKRSAASAKRNAATIKKRVENLGEQFLQLLANSSASEANQLMFAAILINSPLLVDFMRTVVKEAKRVYRQALTSNDWQQFWQQQARLYPALELMTESSTYKVSQVAFKVLADAGYIETTRNKKLLSIYVVPEIRELLVTLKREDIVQAMEI